VRHAYANSDGNANSDTYTDGDANGTFGDANGDSNSYAYTDSDSYGYGDSYCHCHVYCHSYGDCHTNSRGHTTGAGYSYPKTSHNTEASAVALIGIVKAGTRERNLASSPLAVREHAND
jgi:hypothetical protein